MKLRMKRKAMVILAAGMLMSAAAPAAAMAAEKATGPALTASYNGDVNTLEAAKDATQLIVVIGNARIRRRAVWTGINAMQMENWCR